MELTALLTKQKAISSLSNSGTMSRVSDTTERFSRATQQETTEFPQGPVSSPVERALTEIIHTFREQNEQSVASICALRGIRTVDLLYAIDKCLKENVNKRKHFQLSELTQESQWHMWVPNTDTPRNVSDPRMKL
ncbi:hypothetical protein FGIG_01955 [Fasciola gigantica]|uniref:Uncharacterized protein n=1 Tax=Fasciola gigantica TaxID=46835 RepID=A0A504Y8Y2_FASGI|nr:hypothetical protein FGIG_01955 [Fasciola gigantica]